MSKVAELRKAAGLTQRQLADAVGVTESTIRNLENNRNGVEHLVRVARLCDALDCRAQDLIALIDTDDAPTDEPTPKGNRPKTKAMQREAIATVPADEPRFKSGDCCKIPSGSRVFIDQYLGNKRYAVTWEAGGVEDEFPEHLLEFLCHAK